MLKRLSLAALLILIIVTPVSAQSNSYPIYTVQSGDTLSSIAALFGTSTADLISLNNITDPNFLSEGTELFIPGLEGISGYLVQKSVALGESFSTIVKTSSLTEADLVRINRLTSPNEVFAGATIITTKAESATQLTPLGAATSSETYLELAVLNNQTALALQRENSLQGAWDLQSGQILYSNQPENDFNYFRSLQGVQNISLSRLPIMQGKTIVVKVTATEPLLLSGSLNGHELHFFGNGDNEYIALQGIHRQAETGITDFSITGWSDDQQVFSYQQPVLLVADYFPTDNKLYVDPVLMDPKVTEPEDQLIREVAAPANPDKEWDGYFQKPLDRTDCISAVFGAIRSYNDSPFIYSHAGTDFAVCANNLNIYAAAPGTVVLAKQLDVRGNAVVIDHGWGVYTGYWHQSKILVSVGEHVKAGQIIGQVGTTGRSSGPHLHWEVWVGDVQVEPLDWLANVYP